MIKLHVVKRIGGDLHRPNEPGPNVTNKEELDGPEQEAANTDSEPEKTDVPDELSCRLVPLNEPKQCRIVDEDERRQGPNRHQDNLAAQIIADFDLLLVFVRRVVDMVVALRLEKKVAGLTTRHRDEPSDFRRHRRIDERYRVGRKETQRTQQMQGLVDPAVMIEAVIIKALNA